MKQRVSMGITASHCAVGRNSPSVRANTVNPYRSAALAGALFYGGVVCAAVPPPPGYPPPGEYRIDSDTVMSSGAGSSDNGRRVQTDGATGDQIHSWKSVDGTMTSRTFKGDKPVTSCVKPATAADAPVNSPFACKTLNKQASENSSSFSAACRSAPIENAFRRIDPRTWEHTMTVRLLADRTPARSAREAIAFGLPGMSAAERAQGKRAMAELPSQSQMDAMNAKLLKDVEDEVRTASSPEDAESARLSLQKLREVQGGTAVQQTIRTKERWTLISSTCSPAR